jgi:hypothetical protein
LIADVAPSARDGQIVNIIELGANADEYNTRREEARQLRPVCCPGCAGTHIVGHDWYARWAVYPEQDVRVEIRRWKCKDCGKTISLLPSFLHRHRHYALVVIEAVLRGRLEGSRPWSELVPSATPSQRSMRRWLAAFVAQALGWLAALMSALALVLPVLGALDPHGPHGGGDNPAVAVLALSITFAGWVDPGSANAPGSALRVMWRWGWNAEVGRLV